MAEFRGENGVQEDVYKKKALVEDKLRKREDERLSEIQKRREDKYSVEAKHENADFFTETFTKEEAKVYTELEGCTNWPKTDVGTRFDMLTKTVQQMERFLTESALFLPAYDLQKAQETIAKLQTAIQENRDRLIPKKKFAFKAKKKEAPKSLVPSGNVEGAQEKKPKQVLKIAQNDCALVDKNDENLTMNSTEINQKDVALTNLRGCTVTLFGTPSAVHIDQLVDCKIFTGPVSGSVFIDNCKGCQFVIACQQLRIHNTQTTDFYIHVTSRAIIEDTSSVRFSAYNWHYSELHDHYQISGLNRSRNSWNDVDDFNWLASDAKSPNWAIIPDDEIVSNWDI